MLVVVSDKIFAPPVVSAPPPKKEDELEPGEECEDKDEQVETVETAQEKSTEDSNNVRKRVCICLKNVCFLNYSMRTCK